MRRFLTLLLLVNFLLAGAAARSAAIEFGARATGCARHRSDAGGRALFGPGRPTAGFDRAGIRWNRPPHRSQRARRERSPTGSSSRLTNDTDEQIERLIVAPHFQLVGSGVILADLGASRVSAITASQGFPPEREDSSDADVFRLTLDPGTTVTYVAELRTPNLPQLYLWEPDAYKDKVTSLTLYKGLNGISGSLALFLTIVFVVKGAVIFRRPLRSPGRCSPACASTSASGTNCSTSAAMPTASGAPARKRFLPRRCWCFSSPISISADARRMSRRSG